MDYSRFKATAIRLIERFGGSTTLSVINNIPDPDKPWNATTSTQDIPIKVCVLPDDGVAFKEATDVTGLRNLALIASSQEMPITVGSLFNHGNQQYTVRKFKVLSPDASMQVMIVALVT